MLYREQTFAPRALHSQLQQQTNTVNTQKSPPWARDKGCTEACAERFSALKAVAAPCLSPAHARFSHFLLLNDFPPPSRSLEQAKDFSVCADRASLSAEHIPTPHPLRQNLLLSHVYPAGSVCLRKVQGCPTRITFIYQYQTSASQVDELENTLVSFFRVDCLPQSLRTRRSKWKSKFWKCSAMWTMPQRLCLVSLTFY